MDTGEYTLAQQIKHAFIVTSAINSKFGVYTPAERLEQTIDTIRSIRTRIPDAKIVVMECCGTPPTEEQEAQLTAACDVFIDYSRNADVQDMYDNDNWDVVKNGTEIMVFGRVLTDLQNRNWFAENAIDRVHKMSGRYVLNDLFDPDTYDQLELADRIIIGPKHKSQFPIEITTVPLQYMARLWSWPTDRLDEVISVYEDSFLFFAERLTNGGYVDIEHVLYKFLNPDHVHEIQNLGVEGSIAPTGQAIKN
jgi:hypothetical protein